ncbi:MAG: methyltransferase type 11 [uncultured bacterium]|nr:MAG: methyltransferase type 11 [uncultured bacterium]
MTIDYDHQATKWHRDEPKHKSDFCGRPETYAIIESLGADQIVLDIGCGEGYFTRKIARIAKHVIGVDLSEEMIKLAIAREQIDTLGIDYRVGNAVDLISIKDSEIDLCVGTYITNYLNQEDLLKFYKEISRVTKSRGKFILLMPHPILELITDFGDAAKYEIDTYDYIKSRGKQFKAKLKTVQGDFFEVGVIHTTLQDHFTAILNAGLKVLNIKEPVFPEEIADQYALFNKIRGKVACMIIIGEK